MTTPISFTVRPPPPSSRPAPYVNGLQAGQSSRSGPPSRRLFDNGDEDAGFSRAGPSRRERISGFDGSGRSTGSVQSSNLQHRLIHRGERAERPLIIPSAPNRDWREASRQRVPTYKPDTRRAQPTQEVPRDRIGDDTPRSGLRYAIKAEVDDLGNGVKVERDLEIELNPNGLVAKAEAVVVVKTEPLSLDEQALREVLAGEGPSAEERRQRELVIALGSGDSLSEDEAYKRDVVDLPEEVSLPQSHAPSLRVQSNPDSQSTIEDYSAVPVEAFGLAMLRGMGYDPKSTSNTKVHVPEARPQLLGLGATPMDTAIRPTHRGKPKKDDRAKRSGRGFNPADLMVRRGGGEGSGSSRASPDYDSGRDGRRVEHGDRTRDHRDGERNRRDERRGGEYETEDERERRKARERERDRDRGERYSNGDRDREKERSRYDEGPRDRDRDRRDDRHRVANGDGRDRRRD